MVDAWISVEREIKETVGVAETWELFGIRNGDRNMRGKVGESNMRDQCERKLELVVSERGNPGMS